MPWSYLDFTVFQKFPDFFSPFSIYLIFPCSPSFPGRWTTCDNKNNAKAQNVRRQTCAKVFAGRACVHDATVSHGKSVEFNLIQRSILLAYCYIRTFPYLVSSFETSNNAYVLVVQASSTIPVNTVLMGELGTLAPSQTDPTLQG